MPGIWYSHELQDEAAVRRARPKILDEFWNTRIINRNQHSIDSLKGFIKGHPPEKWNDKEINREQWSAIVDGEFQSMMDGDSNKENFLKLLEHLSDNDILVIDDGEGFGLAKQDTPREEITTPMTLTDEDKKHITDYMDDRGMSAVVAVTSGETTTTLCTNGNNDESVFSIHSVGKVFTGMLILTLLEKKVLSVDDLDKPIQISESAKAKLPESVVKRLENVTLHQVMLHRGGLGDYLGNYVKDVQTSLKTEQPHIENLEDFLLYGNGCGLIKIPPEQATIEFDKISALLKNRNGVILHNDKLFYVDQNRKSIEPIVAIEGIKDAEDAFDSLKELLSGMKDNVCRIATPQELERIASVTGRTHSSEQLFVAGEANYSNLGSLLVGLAAEHAYAKYQEQNNGSPLSFNDMLREFIQKPAGMAILTDKSPEGAKVNTSTTIPEPTPEAPHLVANPSGGYWTSINDLRKFGEWLYEKCQNRDFGHLVETYGEEFHIDDHTLGHKGENPSASAMLSVSLKTGRVIAALSNSSRKDAHDLEASIRKNVFSRPVASLSSTDTPLNPAISPVEPRVLPDDVKQAANKGSTSSICIELKEQLARQKTSTPQDIAAPDDEVTPPKEDFI